MAGTRDSTPFCKVFLGFCCAALIAGFCCIIAPILLAFVAVPKYHNYIHEETHHVTTTCTYSNETLKGKGHIINYRTGGRHVRQNSPPIFGDPPYRIGMETSDPPYLKGP